MLAKHIHAGDELLLKRDGKRGVAIVVVIAVDDVRQVAKVNLRGDEIEVAFRQLMPKPKPVASPAVQWRWE